MFVNVYYRENRDSQENIKNYANKCLVKLSKQVLNLLMYSVTKNSNNVCKSARRKAEFINIGKCGNVAKPDTIKCWKTLVMKIDAIQYYKDDKLKIPLVCW